MPWPAGGSREKVDVSAERHHPQSEVLARSCDMALVNVGLGSPQGAADCVLEACMSKPRTNSIAGTSIPAGSIA